YRLRCAGPGVVLLQRHARGHSSIRCLRYCHHRCRHRRGSHRGCRDRDGKECREESECVHRGLRYCALRVDGTLRAFDSNTTLLSAPLISIMPSAPLLNARKIEWSTSTRSPGTSARNSTIAEPPAGTS